MATFNRRLRTLESVEAAAGQRQLAGVLDFFVVDDNSSDGTPEAIMAAVANATVIDGTGDLYWAASMALAERAAALTDPDFYLWLNDDTVMEPNALARMLALSAVHPMSIIVGATTSTDGQQATYGGRFRIGRHPLRVTGPEVFSNDRQVDTFNGNCVLIPRSVRDRVGPIDGLYAHAFADDDFAFRAAKRGVTAWQVAGSVGTCDANPMPPGMGFRQAFRLLRSPKGLPLRSHARFLRRHGGWEWPLLVAWGQAGFIRRAVATPKTEGP